MRQIETYRGRERDQQRHAETGRKTGERETETSRDRQKDRRERETETSSDRQKDRHTQMTERGGKTKQRQMKCVHAKRQLLHILIFTYKDLSALAH